MKRKTLKIATALLAIGLLATVSAAIILSNRLTGRFSIADTPITLSWSGASPNEAVMFKGNEQWYEYMINVQNPTANGLSGVHVELRLTLMPAQQWGPNSIHIEYSAGGEWHPVQVTYGTEVPYSAVVLFGEWPNPTQGYTMAPGYVDQIRFRIWFESNTPAVACDYEVWAYTD